MYTVLLTTAGASPYTSPPVVPAQSGAHTTGIPLQFVDPAASYAYNASPPTYRTPFTIAGVAPQAFGTYAFQSGSHVLGVPEQLREPASSNAYRTEPNALVLLTT